MELIPDSEVEALAQALAHQHGWEWLANSAESKPDPQAGHGAWRERSRKILEAVHQAMLIQIHKDFGRRRGKVVPFAQRGFRR
jgi:hypothetical protein